MLVYVYNEELVIYYFLKEKDGRLELVRSRELGDVNKMRLLILERLEAFTKTPHPGATESIQNHSSS